MGFTTGLRPTTDSDAADPKLRWDSTAAWRRNGDECSRLVVRATLASGCALLLCLGACSPESRSRETPVAKSIPPDVSTQNLDPSLGAAIADARSQVLTNGNSASAWGRLGQMLDAAEFSSDAQSCYRVASALDPGSARWPHLLGLRQLREQPDAALASLERAIRLTGPTNDASRLRRAQALIERGRFAEATNQLQLMLATAPRHPAARLELARAFLALDSVKVVPELLAVCLTNPYTARPARVLLGQALLRMGQVEAAGQHAQIAGTLPKPFDWPDPYLREVQELRQDGRKLAEQANRLLIQRRLPEAESIVTNLLTRLPDDAEGLLLLGRIRLQQRRCVEAEAVFQRSLAIQADSPNGLVQLGMAFYCQSRWLDAAKAFERAVILKPDFAQAHFNLGLALGRSGDSAGARASLREALRCNPGDAGTHVALAEELLRASAVEEAAQHVSRALALVPNHPKGRALQERLRALPSGK